MEKTKVSKFYIAIKPVDLRKKKSFLLCPKAAKVNVPGFESYNLFVHRPYLHSKKKDIEDKEILYEWGQKSWVISEATTGCAITVPADTIKAAIEAAKAVLTAHQDILDSTLKNDKNKSPFPN